MPSVDWVFVAIVLTPLTNWPTTYVLVRLARIQPYIAPLTERAMLSIAVSLFTTMYAGIVILNRLGLDFVDAVLVDNVIRLAVIVIGLFPPLIWLWAYRTGRFFDGND